MAKAGNATEKRLLEILKKSRSGPVETQALALRAGMAYSTVTRALKGLKKEGCVDAKRGAGEDHLRALSWFFVRDRVAASIAVLLVVLGASCAPPSAGVPRDTEPRVYPHPVPVQVTATFDAVHHECAVYEWRQCADCTGRHFVLCDGSYSGMAVLLR